MKKGAEQHWTGNPYRRPNSPFWHIVYEDAAGVIRRRSTKTTDLRIARSALTEQLREIELRKVGVVDRYAETRTMRHSTGPPAFSFSAALALAAGRLCRPG